MTNALRSLALLFLTTAFLAADAVRDIVVTGGSGTRSFRYDPVSGLSFGQLPGFAGNSLGVGFEPNGDYYYVSTRVYKFTRFGVQIWQSDPLGITAGSYILLGPDGYIYVCDPNGDRVLRVRTSDGALMGAFVTAGSGGLDNPWGLAFGPDGNLYVCSANDKVIKYDGTTGALIGDFINGGGAGDIFSIVFSADGTQAYISRDLTIKRYDATTGAFLGNIITLGGSNAALVMALGVEDSYLYLGLQSTISRLDTVTGVIVSSFTTYERMGLQNGLVFASWATTLSAPATVAVGPGSVVAGGVSDVASSDNLRLIARPGPVLTSAQAPLVEVFEATTPVTAPCQMTVGMEISASEPLATSWVTLSIYNFTTQAYTTLPPFSSTISGTDQRKTFTVPSPADYIDGAGLMRLRVSCKPTHAIVTYPWTISIDHVYFAVTQSP